MIGVGPDFVVMIGGFGFPGFDTGTTGFAVAAGLLAAVLLAGFPVAGLLVAGLLGAFAFGAGFLAAGFFLAGVALALAIVGDGARARDATPPTDG
jgi:hypothetical protein